MGDHIVGTVDEVSDGDRIIAEINGREIGIFCVDGEYRSFVNWCAHQGGPICEGGLTGQQKAEFDDETLELELEWSDDDLAVACPWHDWEFDLKSGKHTTREDIELPSYPVRVDEDGNIIVEV